MTNPIEPARDTKSIEGIPTETPGGRPTGEAVLVPAGRRLMAWILTLAVAIAIIFISTRPNLQAGPGVPHLDKVAHFVEYALLSWLAAGALRLSGFAAGPAAGLAFVGAALFGGMDEWIQSSVPGRVSCAADWAADSIGALAGAWLRTWWESRQAGRRQRGQTRGGT